MRRLSCFGDHIDGVGHGRIDITLAARGQIVIPREARDALGLKPGARLRLRVEGGRLLIEKQVQLDLSRWIGKAVPDGLSAGLSTGLSTEQALIELRGRPVPWQGDTAEAKPPVARPRPARPKGVPRK
jgi:AbrB family looped-hinge helix DNA binding protein